MFRGAVAAGRAVWWVWVLVGAVALSGILGFDGQSTANGASSAVQVSDMVLPGIEPWGGATGQAV